MLTDVIGVLLLLPVTRKLAARALHGYLERKLQQGTLRVHTYGVPSGGADFPPAGTGFPRGGSGGPAQPHRYSPGDEINTDGEEVP